MLVRLYGRNFRSLKGDFDLSLVAADLKREDDRDRGVFEAPIQGLPEPLRLLRAIAIFGPNASGKSTVLMAGRALRWLATESSIRSKPGAAILTYEPFLLDKKSRTAPITLGCDVVNDAQLLRYEITYGADAIETEKLSRLSVDDEFVLIDRKSPSIVRGELIEKSEANRLYVKEMQPNVTVLSKLAQHGPHQGAESAQPFYRCIQAALHYVDYAHTAGMDMRGHPSQERFADDAQYRRWIMKHLLHEADVGICDVRATTSGLGESEARSAPSGQTSLRLTERAVEVSFVHSGASRQPVDFSDESAGTRKLFNIGDDWWKLGNEPITLLADELGASLHPRLLDRLIRSVNDAPATGMRSQLIFATHETGLLESRDGLPPALRRDQIYFTRKDAKGVSELYSLAEFKDEARPVHNIRKRYLSGLYGAIPSVEGLSL